jgi:hypothetical protein
MDNNKKTYICHGTCAAHITEEEYNNGLTACGTEGCTMKGQVFAEESTDEHEDHKEKKGNSDK